MLHKPQYSIFYLSISQNRAALPACSIHLHPLGCCFLNKQTSCLNSRAEQSPLKHNKSCVGETCRTSSLQRRDRSHSHRATATGWINFLRLYGDSAHGDTGPDTHPSPPAGHTPVTPGLPCLPVTLGSFYGRKEALQSLLSLRPADAATYLCFWDDMDTWMDILAA